MPRSSRALAAPILVLACALPGGGAHAQQSPTEGGGSGVTATPLTLRAHRFSDLTISLDGRLDEEVWRQAVPVFAGQVTGLTALSQGLGLEAVPSTVVNWRNVPNPADPNIDPHPSPRT